MDTVVIIMILLIVLIVLAVLSMNTVSKLNVLKTTIDGEWEKVKELHNKKFELAVKLVNEHDYDEHVQQLTNLITRNNSATSVDDIITSYIDLTKMINDFDMSKELKNAFDYNKEMFDKARDDYNNDVLKYNCKIKSFPVNLLAIVTGFDKYIYFRKEN